MTDHTRDVARCVLLRRANGGVVTLPLTDRKLQHCQHKATIDAQPNAEEP
jgi:hypothetical protein